MKKQKCAHLSGQFYFFVFWITNTILIVSNIGCDNGDQGGNQDLIEENVLEVIRGGKSNSVIMVISVSSEVSGVVLYENGSIMSRWRNIKGTVTKRVKHSRGVYSYQAEYLYGYKRMEKSKILRVVFGDAGRKGAGNKI